MWLLVLCGNGGHSSELWSRGRDLDNIEITIYNAITVLHFAVNYDIHEAKPPTKSHTQCINVMFMAL